ncbi:transposase [bacterium]|nr:transposase [bacterium]
MAAESQYPQRKTIRLTEYDYSQPGAYFITLLTHRREQLFGQIINGTLQLSRYGIIVRDSWRELFRFYPRLRNDEFCVMPDHFHGIIRLEETRKGGSTTEEQMATKSDKTRPSSADYMAEDAPLSEIIRGFKSFTARRINAMRQTHGIAVWHRGYYEHVIRDDEELDQVREYIMENPLK